MMAQSSAVAHGQNRYAQLSAEAQTYRHLLRLHIKESLVARGLAVPTGLASEIRRVQNSEDAEGQLEAAFTRLVNRFERQYHTVVQNFVSATEISAVSTELHVVGVVQEIFGGNQVNWGCFVALSAFITYIAFECIRTEQPHLIEPLVDHTAQTIDEQAIAFIRQNGGWVSLLFPFFASHFHSVFLADFFEICHRLLIS